GLVVVVVHNDLAGKARPGTPSILDYAVHAAEDSMFNTPPTFAWYLAGLVFAWVKAEGGVAEMARRSARKAGRLYAAIEASNFYTAAGAKGDGSLIKGAFTRADAPVEAAFLAGAEERGLKNLKGHRSVGGMRASLYNAVTEAAVDALVGYMQEFEAERG
ncbi:MAG: aminotransferase class V-fold PLP-dependent enzyme, partial [Gammaproteobacteria bacterium]|nr:aminotransferase class V-fold PLP-dependent enzyme [Gammaproteobacteria bacterium]